MSWPFVAEAQPPTTPRLGPVPLLPDRGPHWHTRCARSFDWHAEQHGLTVPRDGIERDRFRLLPRRPDRSRASRRGWVHRPGHLGVPRRAMVVSVSAARPFLSPGDVADIAQLRLDGLATALALGGVVLTIYRTDAAGVPQPAFTMMVALRWANRQPRPVGSEAAASTGVDGDLRAYAPWDVAVGDTFSLPEGDARVVPLVRNEGGIVVAPFTLDQGG